MSNLDNTNTPAPANLFKPSEIIGILQISKLQNHYLLNNLLSKIRKNIIIS